MKKVLITGATGATGGNAIKKLLELKVPVRALVHQMDGRSKDLSEKGVEVVEGDLSDLASVSEALKELPAPTLSFRSRFRESSKPLHSSPRRPSKKELAAS